MPSIFITGGAAGIGLATAERFGREGWTVGVYDVDTAALAEVQATHPDWITGELDVRDPDQWVRALEEFTSHTGGTLDVLDNNAGVLVAGELGEISPAAVKTQIDIDVLGVTLGAQAALPYQGDPRCASGEHRLGIGDLRTAGIATYSASGECVGGLTEALEPSGRSTTSGWSASGRWGQDRLAETVRAPRPSACASPGAGRRQVWKSVTRPRTTAASTASYSVGLQTTAGERGFAPNFTTRL